MSTPIETLRASIEEMLAAADPQSIGAQVEIATRSERLWLELSYKYLDEADKAEKTTDKGRLVDMAIKCDRQANEWAHQARQMAKLAKVDQLREIQRRLDRQDEQAKQFETLHQEAEAERLASKRLNRDDDDGQ